MFTKENVMFTVIGSFCAFHFTFHVCKTPVCTTVAKSQAKHLRLITMHYFNSFTIRSIWLYCNILNSTLKLTNLYVQLYAQFEQNRNSNAQNTADYNVKNIYKYKTSPHKFHDKQSQAKFSLLILNDCCSTIT